jgi:hypothetical protein
VPTLTTAAAVGIQTCSAPIRTSVGVVSPPTGIPHCPNLRSDVAPWMAVVEGTHRARGRVGRAVSVLRRDERGSRSATRAVDAPLQHCKPKTHPRLLVQCERG